MPTNLDSIVVLPKMSGPSEKGRVFRLLWVMDLVSDYSKCFVTLIFQHTNSNYFLTDTIPPELLSYCTVGSYFSEGRKWKNRRPDGDALAFTINSDEHNSIVYASDAFSDNEYDLSLDEKLPVYSEVLKKQLCLVQQVNDIKIFLKIIPIKNSYIIWRKRHAKVSMGYSLKPYIPVLADKIKKGPW